MLVQPRAAVQESGRERHTWWRARADAAAAEPMVAGRRDTTSLAAALATRTAGGPAARRIAARGSGGAARQCVLSGAAQADRALLPGERRAGEDPRGDLERLREHLSSLCDAERNAGAARGARTGRGCGESPGADLLALVVEDQAVRALPPGLERCRDVSDHRRYFRRGPPVLHS